MAAKPEQPVYQKALSEGKAVGQTELLLHGHLFYSLLGSCRSLVQAFHRKRVTETHEAIVREGPALRSSARSTSKSFHHEKVALSWFLSTLIRTARDYRERSPGQEVRFTLPPLNPGSPLSGVKECRIHWEKRSKLHPNEGRKINAQPAIFPNVLCE